MWSPRCGCCRPQKAIDRERSSEDPCPLLRPAHRQRSLQTFQHQPDIRLPHKDGLNDVRREERLARDPSDVALGDVLSFAGRADRRADALVEQPLPTPRVGMAGRSLARSAMARDVSPRSAALTPMPRTPASAARSTHECPFEGHPIEPAGPGDEQQPGVRRRVDPRGAPAEIEARLPTS